MRFSITFCHETKYRVTLSRLGLSHTFLQKFKKKKKREKLPERVTKRHVIAFLSECDQLLKYRRLLNILKPSGCYTYHYG
jgi:hypothetical protein